MNGRMALVVAVALGLALGFAPPAAAMFTDVETVTVKSPATSSAKTAVARCPAGKRVVGAGGDTTPGNGRVLLNAIRPDTTLTSVSVNAHEDERTTEDTWFVTAYAICAVAPAGLERVAATSPPSSSFKAVTATCPTGKRVLGMGGELAGRPQQLLLDGLVPNSALTAVTVNAVEDDTGTTFDWTVTAYAICGSPANGVTRVAQTSAADSEGPKTVFNPCPAGRVVLGVGGQVNSPSGQIVIDAAFAAFDARGPGFAAWEDGTGTTATWSITAYTICGAQAGRTSMAAGGFNTSVGTSCDPGMHATGSGAGIDGGRGEVWFDTIGPFESPPMSMRAKWSTETQRNSSVVLDVICATMPAGPQLVEAVSAQSPTAPDKTITVVCPAGERVLSGQSDSGENGHILLQAMVPSTDLTTLRVDLSETASGLAGDWSLRGGAVCAPPPPGLQRVFRATTSDSEEYKTVTTTCPAGKHLLGAGAAVSPAVGEIVIDDMRPSADLRSVTVAGVEDPNGYSGPWSLTAYGICVTR